MAKLASLHALGVTDLTSYSIGRKQGIKDAIAWLIDNGYARTDLTDMNIIHICGLDQWERPVKKSDIGNS